MSEFGVALSFSKIGRLISGMRDAYARGENAMGYARKELRDAGLGTEYNHTLATLVAYDLQAGTYVRNARADLEKKGDWCRQVASLIQPMLPAGGSLLEVGVGEGTTLAGVLQELHGQVGKALGFDISWSRILFGNDWLQKSCQVAELFVGDLLHIPLANDSVDVVYSAHSLEPNAGLESEIIAECLRVARVGVVLVEPIYELASHEAQSRMRRHGYVRGLKEAAQNLGGVVVDYRLLELTASPLNPSGVLALSKQALNQKNRLGTGDGLEVAWSCPLTHSPLIQQDDLFYAPAVGLAYPMLRGIPLLRPAHAVIASKISSSIDKGR